MLYGYRTGTYAISDKAWRKLETAERQAGIFFSENSGNPSAEASPEVCGGVAGERFFHHILPGGKGSPEPAPDKLQSLETHLATLSAQVAQTQVAQQDTQQDLAAIKSLLSDLLSRLPKK